MLKIPAHEGLLCHLIRSVRPELAAKIGETRRIETAVVGLGRQGTRHSSLMQEYGTHVSAGIAPGRGGQRIHETIPVYDSIEDCLQVHPDIASVSIWHHHTTAADVAIQAIESGIPIVVLITEGIPLRDIRNILVAGRKKRTILIGGNTPGLIFPPEGIKIGMLPDIFQPEEIEAGRAGPHGVTLLSRSGAVLYHISDGLAGVGIAQNAVIGIGGDGAVGSTFRKLLPLVMEYEHTDLVVMAGEIGGAQEELLAEDIRSNPERYPKPIVALISGSHAPQGVTMGHAGAIVSPQQAYGSYASKKEALEAADVSVVNCQIDLIEEVRRRLGHKRYFKIDRYYERMKMKWEEPPKRPSWGTNITKVAPNTLLIGGYRLEDLIENASLLETAYLLLNGELPGKKELEQCRHTAVAAALRQAPSAKHFESEDISMTLARHLLMDEELWRESRSVNTDPCDLSMFTLGRCIRYLAHLLGHEQTLENSSIDQPFNEMISRVILGEKEIDSAKVRMIEAMIVACVDHGVTPPSIQATRIAASVRSSFPIALASGVGAITDIHGGAGAKASIFYRQCVTRAFEEDLELSQAAETLIREYMHLGNRLEGMGHRVHTLDPRCKALWATANRFDLSGDCMALSKLMPKLFYHVRGMNLPVNVDGVLGAIVADMGLAPDIAKVVFIFGRLAGISAHYFEECANQPLMRPIDFSAAVYRGKETREYPNARLAPA